MKNYVIYNRDEKKLFFKKFENDIINLLKTHNVFFVMGKLEFSEIIELVLVLYEKKIHSLNENGKICITISDNAYFKFYDETSNNLKDFFFFLNDENANENKSNKIIVLDEFKLLQKILFDPILIEFNIIILTNIHKRFLKTDLILSLLKKIILKRTDLSIFIFSDFFIENVLYFFNSYKNLNDQISSINKSVNSDEATEKDMFNVLEIEEEKKMENKELFNDFKYKKTINNEEKKRNIANEEKVEKCKDENREKYKKIKDKNYDKKKDDKYKGESSRKYKREDIKKYIYEKKYKNIEEEEIKKKKELSTSSEEYSKDHIYMKKKTHNENEYSDDIEKMEKHKRKYFSLKNMKLKDLISKDNYYKRGSDTLSSYEEKKKKKKKYSYVIEKNSTSDSSMKEQKRTEKKEEGERKIKKLNCLFVDSVKHSLIYDYKNDWDRNELNKISENEKNEISKLDEWKEFKERLEKINNDIRIFVFHISNYMSYNNKEKENKMIDTEKNQIFYLNKRCSNYLETSIQLIKKLYENKKKSGNILIILNNDYEIEIVENGLQNKNISSSHIEIIRDLYTIDFDLYKVNNKIIIMKDMLFYKKLKNIKYIIDTCYMKDEIYDYDLNITHKYTVLCNKNKCEERNFISKNSTCFRLITVNDYMKLMNECPIPEILKEDISYTIFFLKTLGIKNICSFDYITAPMVKSLKRCFELFYILNLMDINGNIIDKKLSLLICYLPLKFKYSIFLINSIKYKCVYEVSIIISMLINEPIFSFNHKNANRLKIMRSSLMAEESDILSYYNIFQIFDKAKNKKNFCYDHFLVYNSIKKAVAFFNKLKKILTDFGIEMEKSNNIEHIFKAKISSFFYNVSKGVNDNNYKLINQRNNNKLFSLHPLSILNETKYNKRKFIVYTDAYSNNHSQTFIKYASIIDPIWLTDVYPSYFFNKHTKIIEDIR